MSRKSAASLAIVTPAFGRPDPPLELKAAEAEIWRTVVATKPAEWFSRDTHPLLIAYCRAKIGADVVAKQVAAFDEAWLTDPEGLKRYERLLRMARSQAATLAQLATKMRISQQSRYDTRVAANAAKPSAAAKPWESPSKTAAR